MIGDSEDGYHLQASYEGQGLLISFAACLERNAVLRARRQELERALLSVCQREGPASLVAGRGIQIQGRRDAAEVLTSAQRKAKAIAMRPCSPECVAQVLNIRPMERIRWTHDGRLPVAGYVTARTGAGTSPTYRAPEIAMLARRPDIIERWRYEDARGRLERQPA